MFLKIKKNGLFYSKDLYFLLRNQGVEVNSFLLIITIFLSEIFLNHCCSDPLAFVGFEHFDNS